MKIRFCPRHSRNCLPRTPIALLRLIGLLGIFVAAPPAAAAAPNSGGLVLKLQGRDPNTGDVHVTTVSLDAKKVGIVAVDMWNWHWCKTSTMRVGALVPRMNRALEAARKLGMQVFLCPTDVADNYVGTEMVESLAATRLMTVPQVRQIQCPPAPDGGGCTCGPERCRGNYGWDGMHPDLIIGPDDLMPNDPQVLYSVCKAQGITHLLYLGVHTQVCLLGKSIGLRAMSEAGFTCILARDLTDAHGMYDPATGMTPDQFTADVVAHFEKHLSPTINLAETLRENRLWSDDGPVDPVRIAPWGTRMRPHLFEERITVTLSAPLLAGAEIFYTLDGSAPSAKSSRYSGPFIVAATTLLRTLAIQDGRPVSIESEGYWARLGPKPPAPSIHLSELKPLRAVGPGHSPAYNDHRFSPGSNPPQMDLTNRKQPLRLRGERFEKGVGMHAPSQLIYELKPEYERFVAEVGVDDYLVDVQHGSNLGMHPSVVFKVFIDGKLAASSPVMRILEVPWRMDVPIPPGSRRISLVATDAGDGNREDLANWVNAGFVLRTASATAAR